MAFERSMKELIEKIDKEKSYANNEQATKIAFINPFLDNLGYDVRDPRKVQHEYSSEAGGKKGEKVDYAIMKDGIPVMIVEAKHHDKKLTSWGAQLQRYFNVMPSVKFAILTNGIEYKFFTDFDEINMLDNQPFMHINLNDMADSSFKQLEKFAYDSLDLESAYKNAAYQKYMMQINDVLVENFETPSDGFIEFFARNIDIGQKAVTGKIKEELRAPLKQTLDSFITNKIRKSLLHSLGATEEIAKNDANEVAVDTKTIDTAESAKSASADDLQALMIVRAIVAEFAPVEEMFLKNTTTYATILRYNKTTRWIVRIWFSNKNIRIEINAPSIAGQKFNLESLSGFYDYKKAILEALEFVSDEARG